jgi:hypothetical protein
MLSPYVKRIPRRILEPLLRLWCEDEPPARQYLHWHRLPDEPLSRRIVDRDGLYAFRAWIATQPSGPSVEQQALLLHVVSLSYEAGFITDPEECKRLCVPQAPPPI